MIRLLKTLPLLALTGAVGLAGLARADDDKASDHRLQQAFGSTIVSTYPDGRQGKLWLKADGTYTAEGRKHQPSADGNCWPRGT